jgi:hypothetical protein
MRARFFYFLSPAGFYPAFFHPSGAGCQPSSPPSPSRLSRTVCRNTARRAHARSRRTRPRRRDFNSEKSSAYVSSSAIGAAAKL